ncbi:FAD-binding oxidoreductase [Cyanobium sp. Alchichica 3B3-8F6]|uniref:FAD-binding oxidoreductase n=1 Tax=Cyanobium sp. Alchichica 3B3-8F6 TaxID=2823696 RepID=UPI0020CEC7D5|nr:FAD-binding oxidoreductase [Cyanobium sp. Alchichica 3B3-8F6]MCP9881740.1 FAD-binding oxidoreductase [Cyanobium sp. Alchichica 3B3-8F6]
MITPEPSELQELVRALHRQATPWQPAGLGSRLSWGPPVAAGSTTVSCGRLRGIVEHSPGDFTVTAQAGTPLVEVQAELAHHGQWLALDWPWGSGPAGEASGSLGGLVARGLAGGLRQRYLGVRDQLIGIELIRADGTRARAGGKVVKNVAGYDLMRLFTGSWGALGLITSVTLRTLPLPPQRRGLWLSGPLEALGQLSGWLLSSSLSPERIDWWRAGPAQGGDTGLLISLASINARTLDEQITCIAAKATPFGIAALPLEPADLDARVAESRGPGPEACDWLLRLAVRPSEAPALLAEAALTGLPVCLSAGSGIGFAWAAADQLPAYRVEALRRSCLGWGGYLTVLRQPAGAQLPAWLDAPSRPMIEAIKRQFDPKQLLARGRLPGVQPPPH